MIRIAALVSGGGTNLQAVLDAIDSKEIDANIVVVISSNASAYALTRAELRGIKTHVFAKSDYENAAKRDEAMLETLQEYSPDLIILSGYLGVLQPCIVRAFCNRIINIHPALLPSYGGIGMFGINVHRAVISAKEAFTGATAHYVDEGTDTGKIILQRSIPVLPSDTEETLQQRVLNLVEHRLIVDAINIVIKDLGGHK